MADDSARNEACKTYLEQTKLLVTLASAFIVAPAVLFEKINFFSGLSLFMEICFILSVFTGYIVFGTISGTQFKGNFNVYNKGTMWFSRIQIFFFFFGLVLLLFNFKSNLTESKEVKVKQTLTPPYHQNDKIKLNNIFFDIARWNLRPESFAELSKLVDTLKKYPNLKIEIQAHTDNVGLDSFNLTLSEKRASSVMQYLISEGVPSSQLSSKGYGEIIPITTNNTYEGRQINRRVEFKVLKTN